MSTDRVVCPHHGHATFLWPFACVSSRANLQFGAFLPGITPRELSSNPHLRLGHTPSRRSAWQGHQNLYMTTAYHPADALLYEFGLTSTSIYIVRLLAYCVLPASWAYVLTSAFLIAFINDNPWKLAPRGLGERYVQGCS